MLTLTLTGTSSVLEAQYFPPIQLSSDKKYSLALISFLSSNTIPNIDENNNTIKFIDVKTNTKEKFIIPTGSYEIKDLATILKPQGVELTCNNNTLHSQITTIKHIDFHYPNSPAQLLGFQPQIIVPNKVYESNVPVNIFQINQLRIECNITTGAYINNQKVHTIHSFFPVVPAGYKIIEVPASPIYLPISVKTIDHLQIRIVDQNGRIVNFRGETITITLHVKI